MRGLWKRIEAVFAAVAFAEEGDVETARRLVADAGRDGAEHGAPEPRPARRLDDRRPPARRGKIALLP